MREHSKNVSGLVLGLMVLGAILATGFWGLEGWRKSMESKPLIRPKMEFVSHSIKSESEFWMMVRPGMIQALGGREEDWIVGWNQHQGLGWVQSKGSLEAKDWLKKRGNVIQWLCEIKKIEDDCLKV